MWPFRSSRRFEVLTALALVVAGREAVADGLAALALEDPQLRRWAARLVPPLRAGRPLDQLLLDHRLVTREQAAAIAAADGAAAVGARLKAIAAEAHRIAFGYACIRWYPLLLGCAALLPSLLLVALVEGISGLRFRSLAELTSDPLAILTWDVYDPYLCSTSDALATPQLAVASLALLGALALGCWLLPKLRILHYARLALCPDAHRTALALRLTRQACATGAGVAPSLLERGLMLTRCGAWRRGEPQWRAGWREWSALSFFRGSPTSYLDATGGDLATAIDGMGLVPAASDGVRDWNAAEALAVERHDTVVAAAWPFLGLAAIVVGVVSFLALVAGFSPQAAMLNIVGKGYASSFSSIRLDGSWESVLEVIAFGLTAVVSAMLCVMLAQALWAGCRLFAPGLGPMRVICARLAESLRRGDDVHGAIVAAGLSLPAPFPGRVDRCLERIEAGGETLVACLCAARLIPRRFERDGMAHEALGRSALAEWFADRAAGASRSPGPLLAAALPTMLVTAAFTFYMLVGPLRREERMMRSLHLELPAPVRAVMTITTSPWLPPMAPLAAMAAVLVFNAYLAGWLPGQIRARRIMRGRLIVRAAWSGAAERAISDALATTYARPPQALQRAGEAGDLVAMMRACGWTARDPADLARLVEQAESRRDARRARRLVLFTVIAPVVLAIPVLLMALTNFSLLATLVHELNVSAGHQDAHARP